MQALFASHLYDDFMKEKNATNAGQRLRTLREAAGLSQREMARQLNVHYSNISYWESTGLIPRSNVLAPMAQLLGVSVEQLLGEASKRKAVAVPSGRARLAFDKVSKLPKRQQQKILEVVEAFVNQHANEKAA